MAAVRKTYRWKNPRGLAHVSLIILAVGVLALLAQFGVALLSGSEGYAPDGVPVTGPQRLRAAADLLQGVVVLACVVVLAWIWRANANAHVFKPTMRFSPLGAIGFYVVPVVSWFLPFAAMEEIWYVSAGRAGARTPPLLRWWWAIFLLNGVAALFSAYIAASGGAPAGVLADLVTCATGIVCSLLLMRIIREVTQMQCDRYESGDFGASPGVIEQIASS